MTTQIADKVSKVAEPTFEQAFATSVSTLESSLRTDRDSATAVAAAADALVAADARRVELVAAETASSQSRVASKSALSTTIDDVIELLSTFKAQL